MPTPEQSPRDGDARTTTGVGDGRSVWEDVALTDGTTMIVRSVEPGDADALATGYEHLSAHSVYQRFFTTFPRLSSRQLQYFTDVDHQDHEALGAIATKSGDGIGVARYIRSTTDPTRAELAIIVTDAWQRRGVGYQLLRVLLRRARDEDITTVSAEVLSDNPALLALLRRFGPVDTHVAGPTTTATLSLGPPAASAEA